MTSSARALGIVICSTFSAALMAAGWWMAWHAPVCSGGHFFGTFLIGAGGLTLVRLIAVQLRPTKRRTDDDARPYA